MPFELCLCTWNLKNYIYVSRGFKLKSDGNAVFELLNVIFFVPC
uniref:Uncharacterized protein n=1 Tax=Arundo donax TaxID=35708 RepID=A0A0A9B991_ARUDO